MDNKDIITAKEYMESLKNKKVKITNEYLNNFYNVCIRQLEKFIMTGQTTSIKKLKFHIENVERERKLIEHGIDTYVTLSDISEYINKVENKDVKIIEMEEFQREMPMDIVDTVVYCKENNLFDAYFIVFTDYTKEHEKEVKSKRKEKDPILFGAFYSLNNNVKTCSERFYYLGDWEDEYCDLTLEKMINVLGQKVKHNIDREEVNKPAQTYEELKEKMKNLNMLSDETAITISKSFVSQIPLDTVIQNYNSDKKIKKENSILNKLKGIFKK